MEIKNSTLADIDTIMNLYQSARVYQQKINAVIVWPEFDQSLVLQEIKENKQWKILENEEVACVWATTFSDPQIWEVKNNDAAIYIHRIATNPKYRGRNYVYEIVQWAKTFAKQNKKQFVRLDTVGNNTRLIEYYQQSGFDFLGLYSLIDTEGLPEHYTKGKACLFELKVD